MSDDQATTPQKKKHAGGRPTKYRKEYCADLVEHMRTGASAESLGIFLVEKYKDAARMVGRQAIYDWFERYPEFADAKDRGEILSERYWLELGKQGMTGQLRKVVKETPMIDGQGKPIVGPDGKVLLSREFESTSFGQAAWIFTMKNKFHWRDRMDTTSGDKPLPPPGTPVPANVQVVIELPDNGRDKTP